MWKKILEELIEDQKKRVLLLGREFIPHLTPDDILQPNDFPQLENHPYFRYEEGILAGLLVAQIALLAENSKALFFCNCMFFLSL